MDAILRHLPMYEATYSILGLNLAIRSDAKDLLDRFQRDYACFLAPKPKGSLGLAFTARFHAEPPALLCEGAGEIARPLSLAGHPSPVAYALMQILRAIFSHLTEFRVLHAGVVARGGRAIVLSGPPGVGKTTLVMALMKKGFSLFSDDVCPIHRKTRAVHPFPRSLWVRSPDNEITPSFRRNKRPISAGLPGTATQVNPVPVGALVCLDPGGPAPAVQELHMGIRPGRAASIAQGLRAMPGVSVTPLGGRGDAFQVRFPSGGRVTRALQAFLDGHEEDLWNVYRVDRPGPEFDRNPVLSPIPSHEAAFTLLRDMKSADDLWVSPKRPGLLLLEVTDLLGDTATYRMTVGRLGEMVETLLSVNEAKKGLEG